MIFIQKPTHHVLIGALPGTNADAVEARTSKEMTFMMLYAVLLLLLSVVIGIVHIVVGSASLYFLMAGLL